MSKGVRIALVILAVHDLHHAVRFYQEAFGSTCTVDVPVYVEFSLSDGFRLGLYERKAFSMNTGIMPGEIQRGGISATELYLYADELETLMERLEEGGARRLSPLQMRSWGEEVAYYTDPDGNVLAIARAAKH
jgi:uncharacterized glyoxalase superfamily protein PhnB